MSEPPDHVRLNRALWDVKAIEYAEIGRRSWAEPEPSWGVWGVPDSELKVLPDVRGADVIELGCGTAYFSSWLARRGARVVGIDNSPQQLRSAQRMVEELALRGDLEGAQAVAAPGRPVAEVLVGQCHPALLKPSIEVHVSLRRIERGG